MKNNSVIITIFGLALMLLNHRDAMAQVTQVDLGTAGSFGVLGGSTVTNTGSTTITGDVGVSPGSAVTGFPPGFVNGTVHAANAVAAQAQSDLTIAYLDAAGRSSTAISPDLSGATFVSGVYSNAAGIAAGSVTLDGQGNSDAVWIFQSTSTLIIANNTSVVLINGANACNVFWQVSSSATIGTGAQFQGTILALQSITANTGASVVGGLLARNGAVTLDTNTIVAAICDVLIPDPGNGNGGGNGGGETEGSPTTTRKELEKALIFTAQVSNVSTLPGLTSVYSQGFAQHDTQVFSLQQRFADLRGRSRDTARPDTFIPSVPTQIPSGKNPVGGKSVISGKSSPDDDAWLSQEVELSQDQRWGFFITGTGDFATSGDVTGYDGTTIGTSMGIDYQVNENFLLGVSIGYSHSDNDLSFGSKIESDTGKVALYGMYHQGGFYTEGSIGGGYSSYDIARSAFLGDARGDTHGMQFDSYLGMGYDWELAGWTITPMVSLLYTMVAIDGYNEVGSLLPLIIDSQNASSLRTRVGPRVAYTTHWGAARITPSVSAQWQHEFLDDQLPFDARFANDPSNLFTVYGPKAGRDSVLLTAGLNVAWKNYSVYAAYQANLGRENHESHSALVGASVSW